MSCLFVPQNVLGTMLNGPAVTRTSAPTRLINRRAVVFCILKIAFKEQEKKNCRPGHSHSELSGGVRRSAGLPTKAAVAAASLVADATVRSAAVSARWLLRATVTFRAADFLIW